MTTVIPIQVYSDLHIELTNTCPYILPQAKYLFLAGDICNLNHKLFFSFLDYCSTRWTKVFYIPGNHEFYSGKKNYDTLNFEYELKIKEKYTNIFYLNQTCIALNDEIDIYGSVFWTTPPNDIYLSDYREIKQFSDKKKYNIPIDYTFMSKMSDIENKSISKYLNNVSKKVIIMTHFPPIQKEVINPIYIEQSPILKNYFGWNNILKDLNLKNVILWISGHTHLSYDKMHNSTRLISNQLGYKYESNTKFNLEGYFEIIY
jgi:predicted phosphohydrolase